MCRPSGSTASRRNKHCAPDGHWPKSRRLPYWCESSFKHMYTAISQGMRVFNRVQGGIPIRGHQHDRPTGLRTQKLQPEMSQYVSFTKMKSLGHPADSRRPCICPRYAGIEGIGDDLQDRLHWRNFPNRGIFQSKACASWKLKGKRETLAKIDADQEKALKVRA